MEGLGNTRHSECLFLQWFFTLCSGAMHAKINTSGNTLKNLILSIVTNIKVDNIILMVVSNCIIWWRKKILSALMKRI